MVERSIKREWEYGTAIENHTERFSDAMTVILVDSWGFVGRASRNLEIINARVRGILRAYATHVR